MDAGKKEETEFDEWLRKAYGFSGEEISEDIENARKTVGELHMEGAEERIYRKLLKRAEEEKKAVGHLRRRKRRLVWAILLAVVFMLALGFTAAGRKRFVFKEGEGTLGSAVDFEYGDSILHFVQAELGRESSADIKPTDSVKRLYPNAG